MDLLRLLRLGDGLIPPTRQDGYISLPFGQHVTTADQLKQAVFPGLNEGVPTPEWLTERAILAPKNVDVNILNNSLTDSFPGDARTYFSINRVVGETQTIHYPIEFLNSLQPPGFPTHRLCLKVGMPIMVLRNLDPPRLCNGTRLVVKQLLSSVIEATILTGNDKGQTVFIPRIPLKPNDLPFEFKRLQFPVKPCFAMSINKTQGQTLQVAGLYLESPCFSHGQLYVACSRIGNPEKLYVYTPDGYTRNIVYQEIFNRRR